jgi:dTDP-4-amino-4,6-dideoxygalactose transaminase
MSLARSIGAEFDSSVVRLCGSGTDALQRGIRLAAARVGRRAAVALPAYSCFDLASAAIGTDLPIVLYDLDPDTLGPDLDSLRHALAAGARVVVISPLYGMPVDWAEIEALT